MIIQSSITRKLESELAPVHLEVVNESHMHSVPVNSETHFKVIVVAAVFHAKRSVARHQMVYKALSGELAEGVHALALHTYTEQEWQEKMGMAPVSPQCLGGSKDDS